MTKISKTRTTKGARASSPTTPSTAPKPAHSDEAPLMTVAEVACLDRVSARTVRRAIAAEQLEALRLGPGGRTIRISRAAHAVYRRRLSGRS